MDNLTPKLTVQQLKENIDALKKGGIDNTKIQSYVDNYKKDSDGNYSLKNLQVENKQISSTQNGGLLSGLKSTGKKILTTAAKMVNPVIGQLSETKTGSNIAGKVGDIGLQGLKEAEKPFLQPIAMATDTNLPETKLTPAVSSTPTPKESLSEALSAALTVAGLKGAKTIAQKTPQILEKSTQFLSSEPNAQLANIIKNVPKSKFDNFISVAARRSEDLKAPSVYEKVSQSLTNATKQLKQQANSLGEQKSTIINKAKIGLSDFTKPTRKTILEVSKLDDSPIKNQVIDTLKSVKTKLDADKAVDKIQEIIYNAKGTKLIAEGSKIEKQIKGIIGTYNNELKSSLPKAYQNLNAKYSNRIKVVQALNKALGETVNGVPTRGASLVKQFFSPSGTKTKELFSYIKSNTGIDLAEDAALAKFAGEIFDDTTVKSLLEGLPTTKQGILSKAVDFAAEKSGLANKVKETIKKGTIEKARSLTK